MTATNVISNTYTNEHNPHSIMPSPPVHFLPKNVLTILVASKTPGIIAAYCINTTIYIIV